MNNPIVYLLVGVLILGGLFFFFKPKTQTPFETPVVTPTPMSSPLPTPETNIKTFELVIKGKKLVSGPETIKVNKGDEITIKITSDIAEELHVHAYDKSIELEPNKQVSLTFTATLAGKFPFELEQSKTEIGTLEVQPKQ